VRASLGIRARIFHYIFMMFSFMTLDFGNCRALLLLLYKFWRTIFIL